MEQETQPVTEADAKALREFLQPRRIQPPADLLQKIDALIVQERAKARGEAPPAPPINWRRLILLLLLLAVVSYCYWMG